MEKKKYLRLAVACTLAAGTTTGWAAEKTTAPVEDYGNETMMVTATRVKEETKDVPANVTVITAKELAKRNVFSVREALQREAGIYVSPTAETKDGLSLRGFYSTNLLVMLNGQEINTAFDGTAAWDTIPLGQIERIEIVRGAGSSLYGGHAVAGVINIITKKPEKGDTKVNMETSYGSNKTWKRGINVSGRADDRLSFSVGYEKRSTGGWVGKYETADGRSTGTASIVNNLHQLSDGSYVIGGRGRKDKISENISLDLHYDFSKSQSLEYYFMHNSYDYTNKDPFSYLYDSTGKNIYAGTVKTQNGDYVTVEPSDFLGYKGERGQDMHRLSYEDTQALFKVGLGYSNVYKEGYSSTGYAKSVDWAGKGGMAEYPSQNYNFDLQKIWKMNRHTLVAGAAWMKESMKYTSYSLSNWLDWNTKTGVTMRASGTTRTTALFAQDEYQLAPQWKMYTGLRYDYYQKVDGSSTASGVEKTYEDSSFSSWSPKLSFSYEPVKGTTLFASYGHSFNPPSIYKLYRRAGDKMSSVQANPDLKPEKSNTFELGLKRQMNKKTSLGITLFRINTEDKIALATRNKVKAYYNMNSALSKGVEFELKNQLNPNWNSYVNYTFETGEYTSNGQTASNYDIPKHLLHFGVDYTKNKFEAVLDAQYVGARQTPDAVTGEYGAEDAFFTMNAYFNYCFDQQYSMQFGVENLLDRTYYASEAANGRTYTLGVKYAF